MARTIGEKNINIVIKITNQEIKKKTIKSYENKYDIMEIVVSLLPDKMFEIWEGAHNEIICTIKDTIWSYKE